MISYLSRRRRWHKPASLSFATRAQIAIRRLALVGTGPFVFWMLWVGYQGKGELMTALRSSDLAQWLTPMGLAVISLIGLVLAIALLLKWGWWRSVCDDWKSARLRRVARNTVDFGPGLKKRSRLEP